ncbi:MAG: hypothetical protein ACXVBC_05235, partial [Bdellovibrionota bacterium]
ESPIFPNLDTTLEKYRHCLAPSQARSAASISYSETTNEYLLTFVCISPTEPRPETTYQIGAKRAARGSIPPSMRQCMTCLTKTNGAFPTRSQTSRRSRGGSLDDRHGFWPALMLSD